VRKGTSTGLYFEGGTRRRGCKKDEKTETAKHRYWIRQTKGEEGERSILALNNARRLSKKQKGTLQLEVHSKKGRKRRVAGGGSEHRKKGCQLIKKRPTAMRDILRGVYPGVEGEGAILAFT